MYVPVGYSNYARHVKARGKLLLLKDDQERQFFLGKQGLSESFTLLGIFF